MKNIILVSLTMVFLLCACGKSKTPVVTEPPQSQSQPQSKTQSQPLEREQLESEPAETTTEATDQTGQTPATTNTNTNINREENEKIPVLLPKKTSNLPPSESNTTGMAATTNGHTIGETIDEIIDDTPVPDDIADGIMEISRGFGYTGDIHVPQNFKKRVAFYIRYFTFDQKGSRFYQRAMSRGRKYLPMIRETLKKKHLPSSLAYLPLVESGFNPNARSHAGAVGMWQFMKGTARMYGLHISRRRDDRKNPVKATTAAAEYLNDLMAMFGAEDPFLGISAYNAGEGKILKALRKISYKERSFWTLVNKNLLKTETDEYIPRLLAVALMANNPKKYAAASKAAAMEPNEIEDDEIISSFHSEREDLSLDDNESSEPEDANHQVPSHQKNIRKTGKESNRYHTVRKGETLYRIAVNNNVRVDDLKRWNRLRSNRINVGQKLLITGDHHRDRRKTGKGISTSRGYKLTYTVNYKDSLVKIALFFKGVSTRSIMRWNGLKRTRIYPKQKLTIYLKHPPEKVITHIVKRGETAGKIARRYRRRLEFVLALNGLVSTSTIRPGKQLKIYYF